MTTVTVRPMTESEFDEWQEELAADYAGEQVSAGRWAENGAVERAREENLRLLPQGVATPRMILLRAVDEHGEAVGRAWIALDHPRGAPDVAFLYDIEVVEARRGQGHGRALLAAVEKATRDAGVPSLELNVFGSNRRAIGLYASAGYDVVTQQMRKAL